MTPSDQSTAPLTGEPVMPAVDQHLVKPNEPIIGKIHATRLCTTSRKAAGFVRHIEIDISGTPLAGSWVAGQSFGVIPPGQTDKGNPHKLRLYSIAAPTGGETGDGSIITTAVKRVLDEDWDSHKLLTGVCSNYMCDLNVGDEITLTGPVGKRFILPKDPLAHDYIFIATGTGIAPFRGMILDLIKASNQKSGQDGLSPRTALLMGVPYESDLLYHDTFTQWTKQHKNFSYHTAISRHATVDQPRKGYVQERLADDFEHIGPMLFNQRTLIYICGMAGMELGVFQTLARLLPCEQLAQYLTIAPEIASDIDHWERKMIPKKIKKTKRVFLEVY